MTQTRYRCVSVVGALLLCGTTLADADVRPTDLDVIVNSDNTLPISANDLEIYFLMKDRHWPDGTMTVPVNLLPVTEERRTFDGAILGLGPDSVARYWLDQRIRSGESAPRSVDSAAMTLKIVGRLKGAIGYVPAPANARGIRVVARIRGGKVLVP